MKPTFVDVRVTREFPFPLAETYAWLTDYQDDDPDRTDRIVKRRPVITRAPDKVTMEGELELFGGSGTGTVEVALHPPDHYVATIIAGQGRGCVFDYKLTPTQSGRATRLDVAYHIRVKRWRSRIRVTLGRPLLKRQLDKMWEGFAASMQKELAAGKPAATSSPG